MVARQDTLWERFLKPVFGLLIDEKKLQELDQQIDWERECDRLKSADITYPDYYKSQNFHGIDGGYLNRGAALTYDPITQNVLPPHEIWVRQGLVNLVKGTPRRILDLGCGTGSTTLLLKQKFPQAQVTGLDLSCYMLAMASYKAKQARLDVHWQQGLAEATRLPEASFDLIAISLLFHETPESISKAILRECFRLLMPSGQVVILDGNQKTLRHTSWLTEVFEEPYIKDYAQGSVDAWLGAANFEAIQTEDLFFIHQVSSGFKGIPIKEYDLENEGLTTAQLAF